MLLESNSAKDLACLIAGYYRLFVDPVTSIFLWPGHKQQVHRVSAEEGEALRLSTIRTGPFHCLVGQGSLHGGEASSGAEISTQVVERSFSILFPGKQLIIPKSYIEEILLWLS